MSDPDWTVVLKPKRLQNADCIAMTSKVKYSSKDVGSLPAFKNLAHVSGVVKRFDKTYDIYRPLREILNQAYVKLRIAVMQSLTKFNSPLGHIDADIVTSPSVSAHGAKKIARTTAEIKKSSVSPKMGSEKRSNIGRAKIGGCAAMQEFPVPDQLFDESGCKASHVHTDCEVSPVACPLAMALSCSILIFIVFGWALPVMASTVYISQSGGSVSCGADGTQATTAAWPTLAAGNTYKICGNVTTQIIQSVPGTSGSPVSIIFESNGGVSLAFCPSNGCWDLNGSSYVTIDGGTACGISNGVVSSCASAISGSTVVSGTASFTNTANGTGLANQVPSQAIYCTSCNHVEIRNLLFQNLYVDTSTSDEFNSHSAVNSVVMGGSNNSVHDTATHDAGWALIDSFQSGDTNVQFYNNFITRIDHGITFSGPASTISAGSFYLYGNYIFHFSNWDDASNFHHHDAIHCFSGATGGQNFTALYIYNNTFGDGQNGSSGAGINGFVYLEGSTGPPCASSTAPIYVFNNVWLIDHFSTAGHLFIGSGKGTVYNNTLISTDSNSGGTCATVSGAYGGIGAASFENNAIGGCFILASYIPGSWVSGSPNYDQYAYTSGNSATDFYCSGQTSLSGWKACIGGGVEANSAAQTSINVSTTTGKPNTGSPVIGAGVNLFSICNGQANPGLGALCSDAAGLARPTSAAWDIGAYQYQTPASLLPVCFACSLLYSKVVFP